jgi:hypothetical protein
MNEIIIDGIDSLYEMLNRNQMDPAKHGPFASFHAKVAGIKDPNGCSCKKGKAAQDIALRMYMSLPATIRVDPMRSVARQLLGEGTLVFKANGVEFAKVV